MLTVRKIKVPAVVVVFLTLMIGHAEEAEARLFRGFFRALLGRPRIVRRASVRRSFPIASRSCRSLDCGRVERGEKHYIPGQGYQQHHQRGYENRFVHNQFDPNDFTNLDPFKSIKAQKGQLFEAIGGQVVSQLFIDPYSGKLLSVAVDRFGHAKGFLRPVDTSRAVFAQLYRFYNDNLDKFRSAVFQAEFIDRDKKAADKARYNLDLVTKFRDFAREQLGENRGPALRFDFSKMTVPDKYKKKGEKLYSDQNVAVSALNTALNMLSNKCELACVGPKLPGIKETRCQNIGQVGGKTITANLSGLFDQPTIDYMTSRTDDPYYCPGLTDPNTTRVDHFIATNFGFPDRYYAIKQIPRDLKEYFLKTGMDFNTFNKAQPDHDYMVVGPGESIVAAKKDSSRILDRQDMARRRDKFGNAASAYISFDYSSTVDRGLSRIVGSGNDILHDPLGSFGSQKGGEGIVEQCNGLHTYLVADGNAGRAAGVPGDIAGDKNAIAKHEVAIVSCNKCHKDGFRGGRPGKGYDKHKTRLAEHMDPETLQQARSFGFQDPDQFWGGKASEDSREYDAVQYMGNMRLPDPNKPGEKAAVIYDVVEEYYKNLDDEKVSKEFGFKVTVKQLANMRDKFGKRLFPTIKTGKGDKTKYTISRGDFAGGFCAAMAQFTTAAARARGGVAGADRGGRAQQARGNRPTGSQFSHQTGQRRF